jgi:hypothetical protein
MLTPDPFAALTQEEKNQRVNSPRRERVYEDHENNDSEAYGLGYLFGDSDY